MTCWPRGALATPGPSPLGPQATRFGRSSRTPARPADHHHAGLKHPVKIPTGHRETSEHGLASAKTRDRMASESIVGELALNLLQARKWGFDRVS